MNKRQQAAQETKRKLITAGLELIKESGFDAINVEDITKKAGVAKGTFYIYFKRKEDIVLDISRVPFGEIAEELTCMENMELIEKLTYYFRRFMECVESCGINVCRQWTKDVLDPNNVPKNKDGQKWLYDVEMLKNILENADGVPRDIGEELAARLGAECVIVIGRKAVLYRRSNKKGIEHIELN